MLSSRRRWLQRVGLGSLGGSVASSGAEAQASRQSVYARLGIRPLINFRGTYTTIGASQQWPELFAQQAEAARQYVVLEELQEAIGSRLAKLIGTESAMVTTGAAGAIALGTYACITGDDVEKVKRLPDLTGIENEVIIQKIHRIAYDHAVRGSGAQLVEVETRDQLRNAINPNTAMMYFLPGNTGDNKWGDFISLEDTLAVTRRAGVPVLADCANLLPPWDNIPKIAATGVDLLAISGGKHMRGPQCSGILAGPRRLIRAAWLNSNPHADSNGRPQKVGREEMIALWLACEQYATLNFRKLDKTSARQARWLARDLKKIPGLEISSVPFERLRRVHRVAVSWDEEKLGLTDQEVEQRLFDGEPRIAVTHADPQGIVLTVFMNEPGEEKAAARRLREIFRQSG